MSDEIYMQDDMEMDSDDDDLDEEEDDDEEDESMNEEEGMRSATSVGAEGVGGTPRGSSGGSGSGGGGSGGGGGTNSSGIADPIEEDAAIARRRAIQAIMRDTSISEQEKRMRIQNLMSGGRTEVTPPPAPMLPSPDPSGIACVHYERNCQIVAPCCNRVFGCRICHDELSPNGHAPMNRFSIREVVCKHCHIRQPASNLCVQCNTVFGEYHCDVCNLWMALNKKPFHCHQCGFCRVGGQDAFRHCDECCMCISVTVFASHQCFKDKYKNNCPVCREDMFSSRQSPQDLPCGHAIHAHCFRKLAGFDYRCPICKKTVVSQQSMAAAWEARARDIAEHPMPSDLQRVVDIMCNDCETKSHRRNWHFLGIQCPCCNSFNTVVEQVLSSGGGDDQQQRNNATQA